MQINAANAKLVGTLPRCPDLLIPIPDFSWTVTGGTPGLPSTRISSSAATLTPTVSLGAAGTYQIRLTACPQTCQVRAGAAGALRTFGPARAELTVKVRNEIVLPPETQPTLRQFSAAETTVATPYTQAERDRKCQGGGGVIDPQWVTTEHFDGAQDYRFGEGKVFRSKISSQDNPLNHNSQDFEWEMTLDPPFRHLSRPGGQSIDVEWESNHVPLVARPSTGDRNWVAGYQIFDCGHRPFNAEIHPPVGTATSRYRRIDIPASFRSADTPGRPGSQVSLGSNIKVPGVSTDIWFNRKAGRITGSVGFVGSCAATALHQPSRLVGSGACIREPSPINRAFKFNIYLPRDPQIRLQTDAGITAPPVPLFIQTGGQGGPDPTIVVRRQGQATWLEVTVRPGLATNYFRRIYAAWALPAADNWGLRRWQLQLKSMQVHNDRDPNPLGVDNDGDWRFFLNTNNRDREWTRVIACGGCVHGSYVFDPTFRTGAGGLLGPDLTVFPDQFLRVATTGFDEDGAADDDTGSVYDAIPQAAADTACRVNGCAHRSGSSGGEYDLNYTLRPGAPVPAAVLSAAGRALYNAYVVRAGTKCTPGRAGCFVSPAVHEELEVNWLPRTKAVSPGGSRICSASSLPFFEPDPREEFALTGISLDLLATKLRQLQKRDPQAYRRLLKDLRGTVEATPRSEVYPLVYSLRQTVPAQDLPSVLPASLLRPEAVPPMPLQPPTQRVPRARALRGPCA